MKVRLSISKAGACLHESECDILDARGLGDAVAGAWTEMLARRLERTTSVGDLMDAASEGELADLDGAEIAFSAA